MSELQNSMNRRVNEILEKFRTELNTWIETEIGKLEDKKLTEGKYFPECAILRKCYS